jgi:hypothetical protein
MTPLEQSYERDAENVRPHYLLTEIAQASSLIDLAHLLPSLRERVHGVGAAIPASSRSAHEAFQRRYFTRFNDGQAAAPRVAAAYDAAYALAYAIASIEADHEVGGRIAQALHWLEDPEATAAPVFEVGPDTLAMSFARLTGTERIGVYGASGALHWDGLGALPAGALEVWCLEASSGAIRFGSAPLTYDVATKSYGSRLANCDGWLKPLSEMQGLIERAPSAMSGRAAADAAARPRPSDSPAETGAAGEQSGTAGASAPATVPQAGAAGAAAEAPAPAKTPVEATKRLMCGAAECEAEREQCCVSVFRPLGVPASGDVSCQLREAAPMMVGAAGAAAPLACALSLQCASDADCEAGSVCCASAQLASCKTQAVCDAELGRRLACKLPAECPEGQRCCLHMDSAVGTFAFTACETTCDLSNVGVRLCASDVDCQDDPTSSACSQSALLPAVRACRPAL